MTTIAYRSRLLATDSLIAYSNVTNGNCTKFTTCGNYTVALAGRARFREPFEEWCWQDCPEHAVPAILRDNEDQFQALVIENVTGQAYEYDEGALVPIHADYTAIGSGALLAIGAMAHGANAVEAVEAAAKHDKNTGGPVTSLSFPITE